MDYGTGPSFNAWFQQNSSGASWFSATVDPDSREMFAIVKWTNGNSINYGGVILDPADNDIVSAVLKSGGLLKLELSTFNNFVFSW